MEYHSFASNQIRTDRCPPDHRRVLQAVQFTNSKSWIKVNELTRQTDTKDPKNGIYDVKDIPDSKEGAARFIEVVRKTTTGKITFRIQFVREVPMETIIYNTNFKKLLNSEKLQMEISELKSPKIHYIGFLDTPLPENRKIPLMKARFVKAYQKETGKYQITIVRVAIDGTNNTSSFYMIVCNPPDVKCYRKLFQKSDTETGNMFYPWNQFQTCKRSQKLELIRQQQHY
jgi:hypothetical protein